MRHLLLSLTATLTIASTSFGHSTHIGHATHLNQAAEPCACGECLGVRADAHRAWEIATLEQRLYQQVDYPARLAAIRAEIDFAEARVDFLRRQLIEYRPFSRFRHGSALNVTIQQTQLELLREQRNLRNLQTHLAQINRRHHTERTLHALRVQAAATQLAKANAALAEPKIEIISH